MKQKNQQRTSADNAFEDEQAVQSKAAAVKLNLDIGQRVKDGTVNAGIVYKKIDDHTLQVSFSSAAGDFQMKHSVDFFAVNRAAVQHIEIRDSEQSKVTTINGLRLDFDKATFKTTITGSSGEPVIYSASDERPEYEVFRDELVKLGGKPPAYGRSV